MQAPYLHKEFSLVFSTDPPKEKFVIFQKYFTFIKNRLELSISNIREISGSHGGEYVVSSLMGCNTV
jgi:hypothetical protein